MTVSTVTGEATGLSFLVSGSIILLGLVAFYVGRALWIVRHEWRHCRADTKILYLLVAPPLTLAVDILTFTDRLFWRKSEAASEKPGNGAVQTSTAVREKVTVRSDQ